MQMPHVFTICIVIKGKFNSSYCFENSKEARKWLDTKFVELNQKYGKLEYEFFELDTLKIGDSCYVIGDGDEEYTITGFGYYSENRPYFLLDSGFTESVSKCYSSIKAS